MLSRVAKEADIVRKLVLKDPKWRALVPRVPDEAPSGPPPGKAADSAAADAFGRAGDVADQKEKRPLTPFCYGKDESVAGCTLPASVRPYMVIRLSALIANAKTNYKHAAIDEAFRRRLSIHIRFPVPDTDDWTKYVVRSRLGGRPRDGAVSDMENYFGERLPGGGRAFGTSRAHGAGVLSITMVVNPPGTKPKLDHNATAVLAMNSEMKQAILKGADFRFDRVLLPKEVNVRTDYGRAVIALNERNEIQDVQDWHEVQRKVGLDSGHQFWKLWGKGMVLK